ncbi:MAG: hypothetical protein RH862_18270 [Leptospiraceae bacterium]
MRFFPGRNGGNLAKTGNVPDQVSSSSEWHRLGHILKNWNTNIRNRTGLTLVEMAIATLVTAVFTMTITMQIASSIKAQVEADRLSIASSLAQTKMSQLLSTPSLEPTNNSHSFPANSGIYAGYEVKVTVNQDKINLQDTISSGEIKGVNIDDKLPAGVQNQEQTIEKAGSSEASVTGGDVNVYRIVIDIKIPLGQREFEMYRVETLRSADKPTEMGTP